MIINTNSENILTNLKEFDELVKSIIKKILHAVVDLGTVRGEQIF